MIFNSFEYLIFLPTVFIIYWFILQKKLRAQNLFLLIISYLFYGWWDWRFLSLIIFSSIIDYTIGRLLYKTPDKNKRILLLYTSIAVNLGFLGFFKYYNFFIDSFCQLLVNMGFDPNVRSLNVILPVGISFYTFQTLSYTIDIYKRKLKPTNDIIAFFAFVSFFPQLVAGPIERAVNLLPQFSSNRTINSAVIVDGLRQILWGMFKKVVVADNCAVNVDYIFNNFQDLNGIVLFAGAMFFSFQIYADFSGYSDIAIGSAKLLGFNLMTNFSYPYFSRNIGEFWRRWHISLSTWFRDYIYIPLGGSYGRKINHVKNILITFTVSGFWHGANWTFIIWGFLNGLYYIPLMFFKKQKKHNTIIASDRKIPEFSEIGKVLFTFILTTFTWIFFRSENLTKSFEYIFSIFQTSLAFSMTDLTGIEIKYNIFASSIYIVMLLWIEWINRRKVYPLARLKRPRFFRWGFYLLLGYLVLSNFTTNKAFIYFQF